MPQAKSNASKASAPTPPATEAGDPSASESLQLAEVVDSKKREAQDINDARTKLARIAGGQLKATEEQKADAKTGLDTLANLQGKDEKLEFALKVKASKSSKDYSWTRTYKEQLRYQKRTAEGVLENYYTRIDNSSKQKIQRV
jgi:hypothetical protein